MNIVYVGDVQGLRDMLHARVEAERVYKKLMELIKQCK
jgi:hypothetical protein